MLEIYAHIPCYIMAYAEQLQIVKPAWNKKCIMHLFGDGYPIDRHVSVEPIDQMECHFSR
jgi:hypothetical protein